MAARRMVTGLIDSVPAPEVPSTISNPLRDLPRASRNVFLALYALFEKEFLPALDLLDRSLITRLTTTPGNDHDSEDNQTQPNTTSKIYLVRSAQQHTNRNANYEHINYYEVRLDAWSCSCPAFTFAAFPATGGSTSGAEQPVAQTADHLDPNSSNGDQWLFGGLTRGSDMPVCKHLLACVLFEHCALFTGFAEDKQVRVEELAGWAAGWGD